MSDFKNVGSFNFNYKYHCASNGVSCLKALYNATLQNGCDEANLTIKITFFIFIPHDFFVS